MENVLGVPFTPRNWFSSRCTTWYFFGVLLLRGDGDGTTVVAAAERTAVDLGENED